METPSPLVTVVIPCYNRARYVREAVDSALSQTHPCIEIIAVDDGSTDETPDILATYGDRIRVMTQANAGSSAARNAAVVVARGAYLAWLDSDDSWLPEKLERQLAVARRWPEAALIHTRCLLMDENSTLIPSTEPAETHPNALETDALARLVLHCYPNTSSCLIRRDAWEQVGGFRSDWLFAEDWEFCLRLAEHFPFAYVGSPLARYRIHSGSKTADRLPHAEGQVRMRQHLECRKADWLAQHDTPALRAALERHTHEFAHVWGRLGLLRQRGGDIRGARGAFREAVRLEPSVLKHRLRYSRVALAAALRPLPREGQSL